MENNLICSKCGSDKIHPHKKGFSLTLAIAGIIIFGIVLNYFFGTFFGFAIGILCGFIRSNKIITTCMACGHQSMPGENKKLSSIISTSLTVVLSGVLLFLVYVILKGNGYF